MKITCLLENTAASFATAIGAEHGLSLHVETDNHRILFDMGQTDLFARNARVLGIDLALVDVAVLSHGHYDHGGGLSAFLQINKTAPVYLADTAFLPHYNGSQKYIGLDTALTEHPRLRRVTGDTELGNGLTLLTRGIRPRNHSLGSFGLTERVRDTFIPDDFRHEQYLLIEEKGKRILLSGCSHTGILDIVEWFAPDVLIGGFHVSKMSPGKELASLGEALAAHNTDYYTCHCTGVEQFAFLQARMPRLRYLSGGETVCL